MSKVYLEDSTLTGIANAIRTKTGGSASITPANMATEIESISGGTIESKTITVNGTYNPPSGVDGFAPVVVDVPTSLPQIIFSGTKSYLDYNGTYDWLFTNYIDYISTDNNSNYTRVFQSSPNLEDLSKLTFNIIKNYPMIIPYGFQSCTKLKKLPRIGNFCSLGSSNNLFEYCYNLRTLDDWASKITTAGDPLMGYQCTSLFSYCYSLRQLPSWMSTIDTFYGDSTNSSPYVAMCQYCVSLDEIINLNPTYGGEPYDTKNVFIGTFNWCSRLKNLTFKTDNGTPYIRSWKKQIIDLQTIGYGTSSTRDLILNYNSGITANKEVTDAASYESLKNDPDWFTCNVAYSRYNHDSAVATINSLPDTSAYIATAGGTNTIRFKGDAGSATDGGAINTLTTEEIAVATNKGWTVALN